MNHFHQETLNKSEKKQASWLAHVSLTLSRHTLQTIYNVNGGGGGFPHPSFASTHEKSSHAYYSN